MYADIKESISSARKAQNDEELHFALLLIPDDGQYTTTDVYANILSELLQEDWHTEHEYIALMLQAIKSPKSIDALYCRCLNKPDYMDYDDSYSLARKCVHGLADINTPESLDKLRLLAKSDIEVIKEKAQKQLDRLLG